MADTNRLIPRQALADTLEAAYKVSYHAGQLSGHGIQALTWSFGLSAVWGLWKGCR